jgi:hypothetical protein
VNVIGERLAGIAGSAGLDTVRAVGEHLATSGPPLEAARSDLLDYTQTIIAGLKDTTGGGDPDNGEVFGRAQATFDAVNEVLQSATSGGWEGAGSYFYTEQNARQQLRSEAMAEADHVVHTVLQREADQIALRRGHLDDQCNFLADAGHVMLPLQFVPRYGLAMKLAVEIAAVQTSIGECRHQMNVLQSEVAQNAAELQQTVGRYSAVADGAEIFSTATDFEPRTKPRPQVTDGELLTGALMAGADPESDPLPPRIAARLDRDNPPGPPAGMPLQDGR